MSWTWCPNWTDIITSDRYRCWTDTFITFTGKGRSSGGAVDSSSSDDETDDDEETGDEQLDQDLEQVTEGKIEGTL